MVRGISFKVPTMDTRMLSEMLADVDIGSYCWNVVNYQAWKADSHLELFDSDAYSGGEIRAILSQPSGLVMLLSMFAFDGESCEIKTYDAYKRGNCVLALLVTDASFVDIYCKGEGLLAQLEKNIRAVPDFSSIEYITDDNDQRTSFVLF